MSTRLLVAGSGKMARDVGFFFYRRGWPVTWASRSEERLQALAAWHRKSVRRLGDENGKEPARESVTFRLLGGRLDTSADVIVECTSESLAEKVAVVRALGPARTERTLLLSSSSSLLPTDIDPDCAGLHFFYPVELTGWTELIAPEAFPPRARREVLDLLADAGLRCIEQTEQNAFALNRVLLPLQTECFRALQSGIDPSTVDAASRSPLLGVGQLALLDSIGLDVAHAAVGNYAGRLAARDRAPFEPLLRGLEVLLSMGKLGAKNRDGLLRGTALPWAGRRGTRRKPDELAVDFLSVFLNTCYHFVEAREIGLEELSASLDALFGAEVAVNELAEGEDRAAIQERLVTRHRQTGLAYFEPAARMRS